MKKCIDIRNSKLLMYALIANIVFQLVSDVTAGKLIDIFTIPVSITVLYFPITYILSDVFTEVYGYSVSRRILWLTLFASITAGVLYQIVTFIPPSEIFENNNAYLLVFDQIPRILIAGWVAVFLGDISNNFVLSKLKIFTKGKFLALRTICSTVVGQFFNTFIFYIIAFYGILSNDVIFVSIVAGWLIKTLVEIILTPWTYYIVNKFKKIEGIDHFDRKTDYNPFKI